MNASGFILAKKETGFSKDPVGNRSNRDRPKIFDANTAAFFGNQNNSEIQPRRRTSTFNKNPGENLRKVSNGSGGKKLEVFDMNTIKTGSFVNNTCTLFPTIWC